MIEEDERLPCVLVVVSRYQRGRSSDGIDHNFTVYMTISGPDDNGNKFDMLKSSVPLQSTQLNLWILRSENASYVFHGFFNRYQVGEL